MDFEEGVITALGFPEWPDHPLRLISIQVEIVDFTPLPCRLTHHCRRTPTSVASSANLRTFTKGVA